MEHQADLIDLSLPFVNAVEDRTPGKATELWLNDVYGPASALYQGLARLIATGVRDGWAATTEIAGPDHRRGQIVEPMANTHYFGITATYLTSRAPRRGGCHLHPYGEINLVVPLDPRARLAGPLGWRGAGWTAPAPGSRHQPQAGGGAVVTLTYLPAGRISYDPEPPVPAGRGDGVVTAGAAAPVPERPWPFALDSVPPSRNRRLDSFARSVPL